MTEIKNNIQNSGTTILYLDSFEVPFVMTDEKKKDYSRRFLTLFLADENKVHRGGSGCVYRVFNTRGETFALKRLVIEEKHPLMDQDQYERNVAGQIDAFRKEYECQQRLSGFKGFPKLYGFGSLEDNPIILMEWVEGVTIGKARQELAVNDRTGQLSPLVVANIGAQVAELLALMDYLDESFVHRDISMNNIMLRTNEKSLQKQLQEGEFDICIVDFGSSAFVSEIGPSFTVEYSLLRKATPEYAPPEMLSNDLPSLDSLRKSPTIDVYALGSVLYELLAGKTPYRFSERNSVGSYYRYKVENSVPFAVSVHETGKGELLQKESLVARLIQESPVLKDVPRDAKLLESIAIVDAHLNAIIQKCLQIDQDKRPSASELQAMLQTFSRNYRANIERKYQGEKLIPFSSPSAVQKPVAAEKLHDIPSKVTVLSPKQASHQATRTYRAHGNDQQVARRKQARRGTAVTAALVALLLIAVISGAAGISFAGTLYSFEYDSQKLTGTLEAGYTALVLGIPAALASLCCLINIPGGLKFFISSIILVLFELVPVAILYGISLESTFAASCLGLAIMLTCATVFVAFLCVYGFTERDVSV